MTRDCVALGRNITPRLDDARLARQRAAITTLVAARRRPRWYLLVVPALCIAIGLAIVVRTSASTAPRPIAGTIVEAPPGTPLPITLLDESLLVVAPESRVRLITLLPTEVRLQLEHGSVDLDVTHVDGREFIVAVAGYEVRVLGTRFRVTTRPAGDAWAVEVEVTRGRVRVTRVGDLTDVRVLSAGERWSSGLVGPASPSASTIEEGAPAAPPLPSASAAASALVAASGAPPRSVGTAAAPPGAKELWAQAENARSEKRYQDEARALNALRLRHRTDARAGLAAFELGRLRQDTLRDPDGAAEAFADAVALAPGGPFREDAEARRVEALDAAGRRDQCIEARSAFLSRYAGGIHRQRVLARCEPR